MKMLTDRQHIILLMEFVDGQMITFVWVLVFWAEIDCYHNYTFLCFPNQ